MLAPIASLPLLILGENTWNQIVSSEATRSEGGTKFFIRLHLGSTIDAADFRRVLAFLRDRQPPANRRGMHDVIGRIRSLDHPQAQRLLAQAIDRGLATHWTFVPCSDLNQRERIYRLDFWTDAPLDAADVQDVQEYLESRQGRGREVLTAIFCQERNDEAACHVLDL